MFERVIVPHEEISREHLIIEICSEVSVFFSDLFSEFFFALIDTLIRILELSLNIVQVVKVSDPDVVDELDYRPFWTAVDLWYFVIID